MRRLIPALIIVGSAVTASARNVYIPVVGAVPGVNNTYFRTDVRIFNPSHTTDIDVSIHFLPQGQDNSNIPGQLFHVPKRQMLVLNNVVGSLYGWTPPLIGALRIDSNTDRDYNVIVDSRTYTDSPNPSAPGTYGQFIPALEVSKATNKSVAVHAANSAEFRTNAVLMNPQLVPASVTASLVYADGSLVARPITLTIQPMSMILSSVPFLFERTRTFEDAFVHFDSDQAIFTGISVVDNHSSDQFYVPGAKDSAEILPLP